MNQPAQLAGVTLKPGRPTALGAKPVDSGDALPLMKRLWHDHVVKHRGKLILSLIAITLVAGSTSLYPLLINWAFDAFTNKSPWAVYVLPWLVVAAALVRGASQYAQVALTARAVTRIETDMQLRLYNNLLAADLAQISKEPAAAWTQRFTTDLNYVRIAMTRMVNVLVRDGLTVVALVGTMIYLDWVLSLIAIAILPLALVPVITIGKRLRKVSKSTQEQTGGMASLAVESFGSATVVKTYGLEGYLNERATTVFEKLRRLRLKAVLQRGRIDPVMETLGGIAIAGVLFVIGWRILDGESTVGEFTGFMGALLIAAQPMRRLGNLNAMVQEGLAALNRYYLTIDTKPEVVDRPNARPATFAADSVVFSGATFGYGTDAPAITDLSFSAEAGTMTAFVGRSGAGKSTIFNLVPRLYDLDAGTILIGGEDVSGLTLQSLRARIAVVSQNVTLFNDTVAANIALGRPGASRADVEAAAKLAYAHNFISNRPDGYDTAVGEGGSSFSGGERQRIVLARAFLKDAPLLLLDEATSALDAESEAAIRDALARLTAGRTTLAIAHRLSTVRAANQIIVLDSGRIVERGTHAELAAADGLYARFHKLQLSE